MPTKRRSCSTFPEAPSMSWFGLAIYLMFVWDEVFASPASNLPDGYKKTLAANGLRPLSVGGKRFS
jgi:hypothetical protein